MAPKKAARRTVTLPDGRTIRLDEGVGRVEVLDGIPHVCELGLALRLGLQERPVAQEIAAQHFPLFELAPGEERPRPGEMLGGWPVFCWISQHDAARMLGLTTRQVQNLETKGLPSNGRGKSKRYALPHLLVWHRAYVLQRRPEVVPWAVAEALNDVAMAEDRLAAIVDRHGGGR
ncbi:MAG TPA: hypothetical protein VLH75_09335 [Longimicrobiales bacterium]|nr:hypothetical protein [Longimicrobiales bacterium]